MSQETVEVVARCHCGQLSASATVSTSKLPLAHRICACNGCRKLSGCLGTSFIKLPDESKPLRVLGTPQKFDSSTGDDGFTRCFCPTCGACVYGDSPNITYQSFCSGALLNADQVTKFTGHEYSWFSDDGALSIWLPDATIWDGPASEPPLQGNPYAAKKAVYVQPSREDKVEVSCFCEGVRFFVTKPNEDSFKIQWPEETLGRWVNKEKYVAKLCACDSCRVTVGYCLVPWMFVPHVNIIDSVTGKKYDFESGTLKAYRSSQGVTRHFCGKCGASVFFRWDGRPEVVDICAGLLRAKSGARGEEWLEWQNGISYPEDGKQQEVVQMLLEGLERRNRATCGTEAS